MRREYRHMPVRRLNVGDGVKTVCGAQCNSVVQRFDGKIFHLTVCIRAIVRGAATVSDGSEFLCSFFRNSSDRMNANRFLDLLCKFPCVDLFLEQFVQKRFCLCGKSAEVVLTHCEKNFCRIALEFETSGNSILQTTLSKSDSSSEFHTAICFVDEQRNERSSSR